MELPKTFDEIILEEKRDPIIYNLGFEKLVQLGMVKNFRLTKKMAYYLAYSSLLNWDFDLELEV